MNKSICINLCKYFFIKSHQLQSGMLSIMQRLFTAKKDIGEIIVAYYANYL